MAARILPGDARARLAELPAACQTFLRRVRERGPRDLLASFAGPEEEWPLLWQRDWSNEGDRRAAEVAFDAFAAEVGGKVARTAFRAFLRDLLEEP